MRLLSFEVEPCRNCIEPAIIIKINVEYERFVEVPLCVNGLLKDKDGHIISPFFSIFISDHPMEVGIRHERYKNAPLKSESPCFVPLSQKVIEQIEAQGFDNPKGDVELIIEGSIIYLSSRAVLASIKSDYSPSILEILDLMSPEKRKEYEKYVREGRILYEEYDPSYSPSRISMWIISANGGPTFMQLVRHQFKKPYTIKSSDWIHDYIPVLGLKRRFIIEVPIEGVIKEAWDYVKEAEKALSVWDYKSVFDKCREAGKVLNNVVKSSQLSNFDKDERWGRAYAKFEHLSSLGLHLEDLRSKYHQEVRIDKRDCETLILITKALIRYAEELLNN